MTKTTIIGTLTLAVLANAALAQLPAQAQTQQEIHWCAKGELTTMFMFPFSAPGSLCDRQP